jgi:hypothetical protein
MGARKNTVCRCPFATTERPFNLGAISSHATAELIGFLKRK